MLKTCVARTMLALSFAMTLFHGAARADTFPSRTVTLVVPYTAGGPIDVIARGMAPRLSQIWKQTVIVENRPGANEAIAAQAVSTAPPDGHTILVSTEAGLTVNPLIFKKLAYNPENDFTPVIRLVNFNMALVVSAKTPAANLKEFLEYAKRKDGALTFGSAGQGSPVHFAYIDLVGTTGLNMIFVPYPGLAPIVPEILAGRIDSTIGSLSVLQPHVAAGGMRALAIGGSRRSSLLPDTPTFAELGFKGIDATFFIGLVVPAKTPSATVDKIAADVRSVVSTPEFVAKNLEPFALDLVADDPRSFKEFLAVNRKQQQHRVRTSGYQPN